MRISDWSSDVCSSDLIDLPSLGTELEPALHTAESQAPQPHREREEGQKGEPSAATGNDQTEGGDGRCHRRCNRCGLLDQESASESFPTRSSRGDNHMATMAIDEYAKASQCGVRSTGGGRRRHGPKAGALRRHSTTV